MARLKHPATVQPPPLRLYDSATETDPLLQRYVTLPPPGGKNDPMVRGTDGRLYSVWGVLVEYRACRGDYELFKQNYGAALTPEHIAAALRFAELYPHLVLPKVEAIERAG